MTKEEIFDSEIAPLVKTVVELCFKHGIAVVAHFATPGQRHERTQIVVHAADENNEHPMNQQLALAILSPQAGSNVLEEKTWCPGVEECDHDKSH